ncbi:OmpA family protein [Rhodocytophaga rosea]|uniref:OmpA family protein n=2 Tax=Rhodocytophaga rosea TaxID=2704465 RepID=A0A6C0GXG8_9BACT|nr:OmpA family protein [Rhodocytophaga rosea]
MKPSAAVARASWAFEKEPEQPFNPNYVFSSPEKLTPVATQKKTTPIAAANKKPVPPKTAPAKTEKKLIGEVKPVAKKVVSKPAEDDANDDVETPVSQKKETPKPVIEKPAPPEAETKKEAAPKEIFENLEAGKSIVLNHIFFDQSKHELRPESSEELDKLVNTLQKYPGMKIAITGHTDNVGDFNLNVQLSRDRAKSVADYLIAKGIASDRLEYKGFGGLYPVSPNNTEDNKKKNRRVEFAVK